MEDYLSGLEKEEEEEGKKNIIDGLNDKLIEIDYELNKKVLCENCKVDKLINLLNEIIDKKNYLTSARSRNLSNKLYEKLKILENCTSCKGKYNNFDFYTSTNRIEYYLDELEEE